MCKKPMCHKIYGSIILIIAVVLGILVVNVSIDNVDKVMMLIKFFDVMIPILAVGALVKYLFCSGKKPCCCGNCGTDVHTPCCKSDSSTMMPNVHSHVQPDKNQVI